MTVKALEKKGLGRAEIDTIKKLKKLWKKSENGNAIGVENLQGKLEEILGEIPSSTEQENNLVPAEDNPQNHPPTSDLIKDLSPAIPTPDAPPSQPPPSKSQSAPITHKTTDIKSSPNPNPNPNPKILHKNASNFDPNFDIDLIDVSMLNKRVDLSKEDKNEIFALNVIMDEG
jgi:hypothetical protein